MRRVLRWALPALVVLVWLVIGAVGGPFFGRLSEVQSESNSDFLPATAESTQVLDVQAAFDDSTDVPAILLYTADDGIGADAMDDIKSQLDDVAALDGVGEVSPPVPSERTNAADEPKAVQAFAPVSGDAADTVARIRAITDPPPAGTTSYVTGGAGFSADLAAAFSGIDGILLVVAIAAVFVILLVVYRSPVLPFLVLFTSVAALAASVVAVYAMADAGWISLNGQAQGILFILVIGAATDYALLLTARFREALRTRTDTIGALKAAWRGSLEPVVASAGTVIAGLLCLLFSDLNSNKALGPVAAAGIAFALVAALTLLPALLALFGRAAFFPFAPRTPGPGTEHGAAQPPAAAATRDRGLWFRVAALVRSRPRTVWIASALALGAAAAAAPMFQASGVPETDFLLNESEAVTGQEVLGDYFDAGAGDPVVIVGRADRYQDIYDAVDRTDGVARVAPRTRDAAGPPPAGAPPRPQVVTTPTRGDQVELRATLDVAPDSDAALTVVRELRRTLDDVDPTAMVGGSSAADLDTRDTASADLTTIVPVVLVVITLVLMALLRSVLAPVLLIATTVLSYLSALGISAVVFTEVFGFPGADPVVPLFAFVFLVALGIDYNIFLATRVREEALRHGTRPGILRGLRVTGGVITSAGIVLATTFAALAVIPLLFLAQIAFIVALGVLIDTVLVRSLLVPALLYDIGPAVWWPSALARERPADDTAGADRSGAPDGSSSHRAGASPAALSDRDGARR